MAVAALAVAGCGGDDDSAETSAGNEITVESGSLTKEEFVAQADDFCRKSVEEAQQAFFDFAQTNLKPGSGSKEEGVAVIKVIRPYFEEQVDEVAGLGAPSGDEDEVKEILVSIERSFDKAEVQPKNFIASQEPLGEVAELAKAYGFKSCGQV